MGAMMRVGSLVYATDQGLGILAKSFWDAGVIDTVCIVRHGKHITHEDWFPGETVLGNLNMTDELVAWIKSLDVFLAFETPFNWNIFDVCRENKVRSVLMPMHECLHSKVRVHKPDVWLCPSHLDIAVAMEYTTVNNVFYIPVPVDGIPFRQRERAEVFVHNAGHGGLKGRNGTAELLTAAELLRSKARLIVRSQEPLNIPYRMLPDSVELRIGAVPYDQLWVEGDVFVFPEKFNGLSLPLQEARAAGMLVMCGDRFPMNQWLPTAPLIPVKSYNHGQRIGPPYQAFYEAVFDPEVIAAHIDAWYGRDISAYSLQGKQWAETMSWKALKPKYLEFLEAIQ